MEYLPPFPWYGGKSPWGEVVWERLGDPDIYIEPFAGSVAILFLRPPSRSHTEVIVDLSGYISNFWRSVKHAPQEVAEHMEWPISQVDQTARRAWLLEWNKDSLPHLLNDPEWYDAKAAGWWCWGINAWIGSDWVETRRPMRYSRPLIYSDRVQPFALQDKRRGDLNEFFLRLSERLRDVVILCDDWSKAVTPKVRGIMKGRKRPSVGIVLDPPYTLEGRYRGLYENEHQTDKVAVESYEWAIEHGDDHRICYFCKEGDFPCPLDWSEVVIRRHIFNNRISRDVAFFSPACLSAAQAELFD